MKLHRLLKEDLSEDYVSILERAADTGDFAPLEERLAKAIALDENMKAFAAGESATKYYKPFVQTVVAKIIPTLRTALQSGVCPEIPISFQELDQTRKSLGIDRFGSPQDVLYGFTSERYPNWGQTLDTMQFRSACMDGQGHVVVTMAPRLLELTSPDLTIQEHKGSITKDFWESVDCVFSDSIETILHDPKLFIDNEELAEDVHMQLVKQVQNSSLSPIQALKARSLVKELEKKFEGNPAVKAKKIKAVVGKKKSGPSQEQIALKYVDEGKFLQKILDGSRVEHLQSNVKMVRNPLRGSKCEVDSIYRVVGEKKIVLVEAKDKPRVSRSQLYQLYETFRLGMDSSWDLEVVAVFKQKPNPDQRSRNIETIIDLVIISFEETSFGEISESIWGVKPAQYVRWEIVKSQTN